jgi:hypothetical protein
MTSPRCGLGGGWFSAGLVGTSEFGRSATGPKPLSRTRKYASTTSPRDRLYDFLPRNGKSWCSSRPSRHHVLTVPGLTRPPERSAMSVALNHSPSGSASCAVMDTSYGVMTHRTLRRQFRQRLWIYVQIQSNTCIRIAMENARCCSTSRRLMPPGADRHERFVMNKDVRERVIGAMSALIEGEPATYVASAGRITGGRADAFVRIDEAEHARRQACGMGAVPDLAVLNLLMDLPLGQPVDASSLTVSETWALQRTPVGAVMRDGRWVVRVGRPVADVVAVVAWGRKFNTLLNRVAPFSRLAARMVVLERVPADFDEIGWQARYLGTGVWTYTGGRASELIRADPVRPQYYKPARWRFTEYAYRAWLVSSAAMRATTRGSRVELAPSASDR